MPALPIQQIQARGLVPEVSAQISSGAAGAVAGGIASLATGISAEIQRQRNDEDSLAIANSVTRLRAGAAEDMQDDGQGPEGMADRIKARFEKRIEGEYGRLSPRARRAFDERQAGGLRAQIAASAGATELEERRKQLTTDFDAGLDAGRKLVYANPAAFNDEAARRLALVDVMDLPTGLKDRLRARTREGLALSAATSMAERHPEELLGRASMDDPKKAEQAVKNDPLLSSLSPEALNQTLRLAQTELNRRTAEDRYDIVSRTKDVQSMTMAGVQIPAGTAPTVEQYTRAFGPSGAARWNDEVGNYLQIGGAIQAMRTSTPEERNAMISAAAPTPGQGFAGGLQMRDALIQAKQVVERQMIADPAQYALTNSPRVQQAYTVMQRVLNDPKQGSEDRAAVVDFFARTSEAEQLRLGIGTIRDEQAGNRVRGPKLLTNAQANAISDQFNDQTTGGANAAQLVQSLEQQWGKYWPRVYGQLATDNKLPPAALVIPNMPNDASRSRMAAVSTLKPQELKDLVAASDVKDIRDATLAEFDQAQRTFTAQGVAGNRTLAMVMDSAEKLATLYRSQGQTVKSAARQAFTETMGWKYQFADTYRVPNEFDAKQVGRGTSAAVEQLIKEGGYTAITGGAPEVLNQDALRNRSMWINTPDEGGLQLMLRGADGGVYAVQGKNGMPIRMDFADLTTKAAAARAADKTQEGHEEWLRRRQQELNPSR